MNGTTTNAWPRHEATTSGSAARQPRRPAAPGRLLALLAALSCGAAGGTGPAAAEAAEPRTAIDATPRVTRAAIFKNGYGFVFRELSVRAGTTVRVRGAPRAVLGTLWAFPSAGNVTVRSFRAVPGKAIEERDCATLSDLLRSGVGRRVHLSRNVESGRQTFVGTIARAVGDDLFLLRTEAGTCPDTGPELCGSMAPRPDDPVGGGLLAFSPSQFDSVVLLDEPAPRCTAEVDATELLIDVAGSGEGTIVYTALEEGLRWVPEYRLERIARDRVRVTLQGAVANDVVDLRDTAVDLVVGVPHYLMSGTLSPLVVQEALADVATAAFPRSAARWARREFNSNVVQTQLVMPYDQGDWGQAGAERADLGDVTAGEADELSLYRIEGLTLGKGERALVRVFAAEASVEDIYKWEVAGTEAEALAVLAQAAAGDAAALRRVADQRVWHHLRLRNRTELAWTTGPAIYFDGDKVVAQDRITYTPAGAAVDLKLTMAGDILVQWDDAEERRERNARRIDDVHYDLVVGRGELSIRSHADEPIELVVVRRMFATLAEPSDSGTVRTEPGGSGGWSPLFHGHGYGYSDRTATRVNSPSSCEWKLTLRPGQSRTLRYQFRYFTR